MSIEHLCRDTLIIWLHSFVLHGVRERRMRSPVVQLQNNCILQEMQAMARPPCMMGGESLTRTCIIVDVVYFVCGMDTRLHLKVVQRNKKIKPPRVRLFRSRNFYRIHHRSTEHERSAWSVVTHSIEGRCCGHNMWKPEHCPEDPSKERHILLCHPAGQR